MMTTRHWDETMSDLFEGKAIVAASEETSTLTLSDGTVVEVVPNEGCGGCSGGNYDLTRLATCENIITKAEVVVEEEDSYLLRYSLFVLAGDERINVAEVVGDDGSGYYGTGFRLTIRQAS